MGNILSLHQTLRYTKQTEELPCASLETRKCVWWDIIVLERYYLDLVVELSSTILNLLVLG